MFRFASPWLLLLLPVGLGAAAYMARRRRTGDARLDLPLASARISLGRSPWVRLDPLLPWLRGLALLLLVLALARPQAGARIESVSSFGVDIVIALDNSGSMRAEDFQPDNRLEVARQTVLRFVGGRPGDRIGLVIFAGLAVTRCPLTLDHEMLAQFLNEVTFALPQQDGTALGMGLATAVNRLRESDARSKVVVLATDGMNNQGQIGPRAAAEAARALGLRVYTIGVGTEGLAPVPVQTALGIQYQLQEVRIDEELLTEIAEMTGGRYFRATDAESLETIFETIDSLEKTEIESRVRVLYSELFPFFLLPAGVMLLLEGALTVTRLRRIP
jgi:Ca-activated chloride channel family protein